MLTLVTIILILIGAFLYWRHRRQQQLREEVMTVLFNYYPLDTDFERTSSTSLLDTSMNSRQKKVVGSRPTYSLPESLAL